MKNHVGSDPLFSEVVLRALADVPEDAAPLAAQDRLRKALGAELGREAAQLRELRIRGKRRLHGMNLPYLTPAGIEQATAPAIARLRAARLRARVGPSRFWDATCGIGVDSIALAERGMLAAASDRDLRTLGCARANLRASGFHAPVVQADAGRLPARGLDGVLLDPDRRADGRRSRDPERWSPPLSRALQVAREVGAGILKLAPALDVTTLAAQPPGSEGPETVAQPISMEWVSLEGSLVEVCAWTGRLAAEDRLPAAVLVDRQGRAARLSGTPRVVRALEPADLDRLGWLAEPDPAVIRSGLVGALAEAEGLAPLAAQIAYLGGDQPPRLPFSRAWRVLGWSPLDRKKVRRLLGEHDIGPLAVRKRGHPDTAEALARRLRGPGSRHGHLAVCRLEGLHAALLLEPGDGLRAALEGPTDEGLVGDEGFEPPTFSV